MGRKDTEKMVTEFLKKHNKLTKLSREKTLLGVILIIQYIINSFVVVGYSFVCACWLIAKFLVFTAVLGSLGVPPTATGLLFMAYFICLSFSDELDGMESRLEKQYKQKKDEIARLFGDGEEEA